MKENGSITSNALQDLPMERDEEHSEDNTTYYNKDETNASPTNTRTHSIILKTISPKTTKGRD
jgi:hypothetical protein